MSETLNREDKILLTVTASEACRCQQPTRLHDLACPVNALARLLAALSVLQAENEAMAMTLSNETHLRVLPAERREAAEAGRDKLREALTAIRNMPATSARIAIEQARGIARAALASSVEANPEASEAALTEPVLTHPRSEPRFEAPGADGALSVTGRSAEKPGSVSAVAATEEGNEKCPSCGGDAGDNHFDRSLCACGAMHTCCNACGWPLDGCDDKTVPSRLVDRAEETT